MANKQGKRKPGRPRTRTMEEFWEKQRMWSKSYYDRNRDVICIKQKIRYYRNKLIDADKADISKLESKIADLEAELEVLVNGGHEDDEEE